MVRSMAAAMMWSSSRSRITVVATPGRWTLTTTCSRPCLGGEHGPWTWPMLAVARGFSSKLTKSSVSGAPRLASTTSLIWSKGTAGHVVLELLQLDDERRRQDVAARARNLPELDEAGAEVLEDQARPLVDGDAALLVLALLDLLCGDLGRVGRLVGRLLLSSSSARSRRARRPRRSRGGRGRWRSRGGARDRGPR